jgi:hypothetical protein
MKNLLILIIMLFPLVSDVPGQDSYGKGYR